MGYVPSHVPFRDFWVWPDFEAPTGNTCGYCARQYTLASLTGFVGANHVSE